MLFSFSLFLYLVYHITVSTVCYDSSGRPSKERYWTNIWKNTRVYYKYMHIRPCLRVCRWNYSCSRMKKLEKCLCVHLLQDALLLLLNPFQRIMLAAQPVKQGLVLLDFLEELMLHLKKIVKISLLLIRRKSTFLLIFWRSIACNWVRVPIAFSLRCLTCSASIYFYDFCQHLSYYPSHPPAARNRQSLTKTSWNRQQNHRRSPSFSLFSQKKAD